jgi:hypothetical protein
LFAILKKIRFFEVADGYKAHYALASARGRLFRAYIQLMLKELGRNDAHVSYSREEKRKTNKKGETESAHLFKQQKLF